MFTYVYTDGVSALNISARMHERVLRVVPVGEEAFWAGTDTTFQTIVLRNAHIPLPFG